MVQEARVGEMRKRVGVVWILMKVKRNLPEMEEEEVVRKPMRDPVAEEEEPARGRGGEEAQIWNELLVVVEGKLARTWNEVPEGVEGGERTVYPADCPFSASELVSEPQRILFVRKEGCQPQQMLLSDQDRRSQKLHQAHQEKNHYPNFQDHRDPVDHQFHRPLNYSR